MKLLRVGEPGLEIPEVLASDGVIRDLTSVVAEIGGNHLVRLTADKRDVIDVLMLPEIAADVRIGPCLALMPKFVAIGLNYVGHAKETVNPIPKEPVVFSKITSSISGPHDHIVIPPGAQKTDWEVELGVVIGRET